MTMMMAIIITGPQAPLMMMLKILTMMMMAIIITGSQAPLPI